MKKLALRLGCSLRGFRLPLCNYQLVARFLWMNSDLYLHCATGDSPRTCSPPEGYEIDPLRTSNKTLNDTSDPELF